MIDTNRPVRVFKNLKHDCYSILQDGRICASAREVCLRDVTFRIRERGRERMVRERKRNVHAFAVGHLVDQVHPDDPRALVVPVGRPAIYDPYRFSTFVDRETEQPVIEADVLFMSGKGLIYVPARKAPVDVDLAA